MTLSKGIRPLVRIKNEREETIIFPFVCSNVPLLWNQDTQESQKGLSDSAFRLRYGYRNKKAVSSMYYQRSYQTAIE